MTLAVRRVWDLYRIGRKPRHIARNLRLSVGAVTNRLARAKRELNVSAVDVERGFDVARCGCGLALPCDCGRRA